MNLHYETATQFVVVEILDQNGMREYEPFPVQLYAGITEPSAVQFNLDSDIRIYYSNRVGTSTRAIAGKYSRSAAERIARRLNRIAVSDGAGLAEGSEV